MNARRNQTLSRRGFLVSGAAVSAAAFAGTENDLASRSPGTPFIDVNVNLSRWPTRRLPDDTAKRLVDRLRSHGVTQAWAGTFDGLLNKEASAANDRLADACRREGAGMLVPFGSINPMLPGWSDELQRCARVHDMRGIRLHPNYHGYALDDPLFDQVLRQAADANLIVQLVLEMEDERPTQRLLPVGPVDAAPLADAVRKVPGLRLVLLNALRVVRGEALKKVLAAGEAYVEIAMLEGVGGLGCLLDQVPAERVLFGSHAPFFYFEAATLKLEESDLTADQTDAICYLNAARLSNSTG